MERVIEQAAGWPRGRSRAAARSEGAWRSSARVALAALWAVTLAGVVGFAVFGTNPAMLARYPEAMPVYAAMYRWMPIGQVVLSFVVVMVLLRAGAGFVWLPAFVLTYAASLASELIGTTWGVPFGEYGYTSGLGPMWLGRVPLVIPLSWFYMAVASYALVLAAQSYATPLAPARSFWSRVLPAAALLTAWDLSLDPAMSAATTFWWWGEDGPYYGMPLLNVAGWFVTSVVLMAALRMTAADRWLGDVPTTWMAWFYGANLCLAMGMAAAAGMWGALIATAVAIGAVLLVSLRRRGVA